MWSSAVGYTLNFCILPPLSLSHFLHLFVFFSPHFLCTNVQKKNLLCNKVIFSEYAWLLRSAHLVTHILNLWKYCNHMLCLHTMLMLMLNVIKMSAFRSQILPKICSNKHIISSNAYFIHHTFFKGGLQYQRNQ